MSARGTGSSAGYDVLVIGGCQAGHAMGTVRDPALTALGVDRHPGRRTRR